MFLPTNYAYDPRALMRQRLRTSHEQDMAIDTDTKTCCIYGDKVANDRL
jgi:hypothetical protein